MFVATKQEMFSKAQTHSLMHPDTNFSSGSGAATKWHETIQNLSFGPKVVDCACLLRKKEEMVPVAQSLVCASIPVFAMGHVRQRNGMKPHQTLVLDLK